MDLTLFTVLKSKLKQNKLAGAVAHSLMAPPYRKEKFKSTLISKMKPKMASVLLLLYPNEVGEMNFAPWSNMGHKKKPNFSVELVEKNIKRDKR